MAGDIVPFSSITNEITSPGPTYRYFILDMSGTPVSGYISHANLAAAILADVDALPSQTGNAGKLLTTDGTDPAWENPCLPSFEVSQTSAQSIGTGTNTPVVCDSELIDTGNYHSTATGKFTPLVAGTYEFSGAIAIDNIGDTKRLWLGFRKNGSTLRWCGGIAASATQDIAISGSQRFYLDGVDDYVEMIILHDHGSTLNTLPVSGEAVHWGGHRLCSADICGL